MSGPTLKSMTPVLIVDEVEPSTQFWVDRMGFKLENEVPGPDGKLIFASLKKGEIELMYQTLASCLEDRPGAEAELQGDSVALFFQVSDLDEVISELDGLTVIKPRHKTFYGSEEIYVSEPGGHTVGFAKFA